MKKPIIMIITILLLAGSLLPSHIVRAETLEELQQQSQELTEELERIRAEKDKIDGLIATEDAKQSSLSGSISYLSYQIQSTELTIQEKEGQIEVNEADIRVLGVEIVDTETQILTLKDAIKYLDDVVGQRIQASYKISKITLVELIASTQDLSSFVKKVKYFSAIREHDLELMADLKENKEELSQHKTNLSEKKTAVEELKAQIEEEKVELEKANAELTWQKSQYNQLLADSENAETEYSNKLQQLSADEQQKMAEVAKIQDQIALMSFGIGGENVDRGDFIGRQGNTGYSNGSHLHFGVYEGGYSHNPYTYINNGRLSMPIENAKVTQLYGMTDFATMCQPAEGEEGFSSYACWTADPLVRTISNPYAYPQKYGYYPYDWDYDGYPNIHNGVDLSAYYGAPILAAANGKVCYGHDGFGAQYAKIDHGEGLITVYWHLQEMGLNTCN